MASELGGILIAAVIALTAYLWGRVRGNQKRQEDQLKRNAQAHERARRVNNEMDGRSDDAVTDWLRQRAGR